MNDYDRYMAEKRRKDTRAFVSAITAVVVLVLLCVWAWTL